MSYSGFTAESRFGANFQFENSKVRNFNSFQIADRMLAPVTRILVYICSLADLVVCASLRSGQLWLAQLACARNRHTAAAGANKNGSRRHF